MKGRFIFRSNSPRSGDAPAAEFIFFIDSQESRADTVVELQDSAALNLETCVDIATKSDAGEDIPQRDPSATLMGSDVSADESLYSMDRPDDRARADFIRRRIVAEHRRLSIGMVAAAVAIVAAGILIFGKLSAPARMTTDKAEFGQAKLQPDNATDAVAAADASTKSAEPQPAPLPRFESDERSTSAVNQDSSAATVSGSVASIPAPEAPVPTAVLEPGSPKGLDSPLQPVTPPNASSKPDIPHRKEAIAAPSVRSSRAIVAPPSTSRPMANSRRGSAEGPHEVSQLRREPQEAAPDKQFAAIRARLLRERMNKWWEEANRDWRMNEDPSVTEDRNARGKVAEARMLSEIDSISEPELLRIEAIWKREDLLLRRKKKKAPSLSTDTEN